MNARCAVEPMGLSQHSVDGERHALRTWMRGPMRGIFWTWLAGCSCTPPAGDTGTGTSSPWPTSPDELEGTFIDVALSDSLRCALRDNGQVACWGGAPPPLLDNYTFVEIDASPRQICGVTPKHDVVCYRGSSGSWQPGVDTIGRLGTLQRFSVGAGLANWCALVDSQAICDVVDFEGSFMAGVARGRDHACAWAQGDSPICYDPYSAVFDAIGLFPGNSPLRDVALHPRVCAVGLSGTVTCLSETGQSLLGPGTFGDFERVWTSDRHACGRTTGSEVICWGSVGSIPGPEGGGFDEVSMAWDEACGIQDGSLVCWTL